MGEIHQHLHQQQQERQQKLMSEARPSPIFNHIHQYNYQHPQPIFQQLQNLPTTHELFHYQTHFQAYLQQQQQQCQEQQRRLQGQQSAVSQDNFRSITGIAIDFKPDLNESSRKDAVLSEEDNALLRGSEQYVPETRRTALAMSHCWQNQEDSAIRQPFWKNFCTDLAERRNKRGIESKDKEEQPEMNQNKDYGYDEETEQNSSLEAGKSRLFGELEAICAHAAIGKSSQTRSGSSLNGESLAKSTCLPPTLDESNHVNANAMALAAARFGHDHGSETSAGNEEEPSSRVVQKSKKRKKVRDGMGSMAHFFECLVKQLMDHQEGLYKKFVEMIERIDKERKEREEAWRRQELEKQLQLEVAAKTHERALASTTEASIVAYLEKITGQSIKLPPRESPLESQLEISVGNVLELSTSNRSRNVDNVMSKRWPKAEVEALIQIRSRLESRFQEPGLKGPLWEEISNSMSSMGFQRCAKRCKEKWENINKYFKKSKENPKERRQKVKTCEYFDQLDQLYSKSIINGCYACSSSSADHQLLHSDDAAAQETSKKELSSNKQETPSIRQVELKNPYMDFEGSSYEKFEELQQEIHTKKTDKHEADEDIGQVEEGGGEGEEEDNEGELGEELD